MPGLPQDHPERRALADEVHARPSVGLETPERASYFAVLVDPEARVRELAHLRSLCEGAGVPLPQEGASQFMGAFDGYRLKWERHGEFSSYTVFVPGRSAQPFGEPALGRLPGDWLAGVPGTTIAAAHATLIPDEGVPQGELLARHFEGEGVSGSAIGDGAGMAFTDFRIGADGFVRILVVDHGLTRRQAGRMLQRLFEIEAYRVLALLALPVARRESARVVEIERALRTLTEAIARSGPADEALLVDLSGLAAQVENALAATQYRFGAGRAYYDLVRARIAELRERRLSGIQTIEEFMARRLAPAMATCDSASRRLRELSERVARASGLLSTRVSIARERQNQELLASMDRRAATQLRLQQAVEGLSVAAITYYVVSLVEHAAKGLKAAGYKVDAELVGGAAIPVVVLLILFGVRRLRRRIVAPAVARAHREKMP